ncbi:hypothetical protein MUK42_05393 [Musa troglodytarum]|uniref:DUF547 domain-containing protein n=1 Tax=Musa troglodytarum TaxID=320322 RepID=A0A9E7EII4_9LILI|nr:hypothetical protein MUK42_05393 [Musa troglodytarum]
MLHSAQAEAVAAATTSWRSATTVVSQSLLPMPWESRATVSNIEVYVQPVRLCAIKMICSEFEIHCAEDDRFDFQVAELQRVLRNEEKMHEVLEHAMLPPKTRSTLQIPGFLPRRGSLELGMPSNPEMVQVVKDKALLDVGGSKLNARAIEHLILRQPFNYNEDDKEVIRRNYGLEHSDPNIVFALCSGCKSSPAVRIYTADGVTGELEKSKLDYLQASIAVTANRRVMIPHFLFSKMHDFATDLDSLAEWIIKQLPTSWPLRKSMLECFKGHTDGKTSNMVDVIPNDSEFQYLLRV